LLNYNIGRVFLVRCVLVFRCGWVGEVSVLQAEVACKTNLYCDILGYDTMQFDMYFQALPWKKFPQNYGQNRDEKYTFARTYLTKVCRRVLWT